MRGHGQKRERLIAGGAPRERRAVASRLYDDDSVRGKGVLHKERQCGVAGDDHQRRGSQRPAFSLLEANGGLPVERDVGGEGEMHERYEAKASPLRV